MESIPSADLSFTSFPQLPIEIRYRIWSIAVICRPRVIQVCYDPAGSQWLACKGGCGGLPSIVHVSREARSEALKGYTRAFNTYFDLEYDTIFISNPLFPLRKPRSAFLSSQFANKLKNVALTRDVYSGIAEMHDEFPEICDAPARILRKLVAVASFTIALCEDGAEYYEESMRENEEDKFEPASALDAGIAGHEEQDNDDTAQLRLFFETESARELLNESYQEVGTNISILDRLEEEAIAAMSKGFCRRLGNMHFESAMSNPDYWETWVMCREDVIHGFQVEKCEYPDWTRPSLSIMAVERGLKAPGDYNKDIHHRGDHGNGVCYNDDDASFVADNESAESEG